MDKAPHSVFFFQSRSFRVLVALACSLGLHVSLLSKSVELPLDQLVFDYVEESEAFASIAVISLLQDDMGLIWVGTRNGLYRFDGLRFVEYMSGAGKHGLPNDWIERMHKDGKGRVWIGPRRGLCRYDVYQDRFVSYPLEEDEGTVKGFVEDSDGNLLILAESGNIYRLNEVSGEFELVFSGIPGASKCLLQSENGDLFVGGTDGIYKLDSRLQLVRSYDVSEAVSDEPSVFVGVLGIDSSGTLWFGTSRSGAWTLDTESGELEQLPIQSKDEALVGSLTIDASDNVLIGTTAGLKVYQSGSREAKLYSPNDYKRSSIQEGTVYGLLVDTQGNLWVGTSRGGLSVVRNGKAFSAIESSPFLPLSLTKKKVTAIHVDQTGRLWAGFHNEGIDRIDFAAGRKTYFDSHRENPGDLGRGSIWDIEESEDGSIWVASNWSGFQRLDPETGKFERFLPDETDPHSIDGDDVRRILPDGNGNFWLGLHGRGLDHFDRSSGRFKHYSNLTREWVEDLVLDVAGNLWIATSDGLSLLKKGSEQFIDFTYDENDPSTISDRHVTCLLVDSESRIWAGTLNGLNRLNDDGSSFTRFGMENGLLSSSIRSLVSAPDGELWVATSKGIARFHSDEEGFTSFDRSDGLVSSEFVLRSSFLDKNGRLLIGSEKGIVSFEPKRIKANSVAPNVLITGVSIFNEALDISNESDAILKQSPIVTRKLILPPGKNSFGFEFAATNFIGANRNQFAYMLEGFDEDWVNIGNRSDCSYTNINPGDYVFRVKASNNDGVWNEAGTSIAIRILPHLWETMWFKLLSIVVVLVIVLLVYRIRVAGLARQKAKLVETVEERTRILREALNEVERQKSHIFDQNLELIDHRENLEDLVRQRTEELEIAKDKAEESDRLKSAFLENVTHEIRTPMNAIFGFMNIIKFDEVDQETREEYFGIIEENGESLIELIDDILDLSRLEAELIQFNYVDVDLLETFQRHQSRGRELIDEEGLPIEIVLDVDQRLSAIRTIDSEVERLDQLLKHLINNAIKFTEMGRISIGYRISDTDENMVDLFVHDTGVGIDPQKVHSIFDRFRKIRGDGSKLYRGTGLGLAIVKRIVDIMGGTVSVKSTLGVGTEFLISLPVHQATRVENAKRGSGIA